MRSAGTLGYRTFLCGQGRVTGGEEPDGTGACLGLSFPIGAPLPIPSHPTFAVAGPASDHVELSGTGESNEGGWGPRGREGAVKPIPRPAPAPGLTWGTCWASHPWGLCRAGAPVEKTLCPTLEASTSCTVYAKVTAWRVGFYR